MGAGELVEATYATPTVRSPLVAATVHRTGGTSNIFPEEGYLHTGECVVTRRRLVSDGPGLRLPVNATPPALVTSSGATADAIAQLSVADTIGKANRKASEGTRILQDVLLDHEAFWVCSTAPGPAGKQSLYTVLFNFMIATPMQCPLSTVTSMARGFSSTLDPTHFVALRDTMNVDSAREAARPYLEHRSEQKFTGPIIPVWNNDPTRLRTALVHLFQLWGLLMMADASIIAALEGIAVRVADIAHSLPDWTTDNSTYFWAQTITQVGDTMALAGKPACPTLPDLLNLLQTLPDFVNRYGPRMHLEVMRLNAHQKLMGKSASQTIVSTAGTTSRDVGGDAQPSPRPRPRGKDAHAAPNARPEGAKSPPPCARFNSTAGCAEGDAPCKFTHTRPTTTAAAARLCKIMETRGLDPSPQVLRLSQADPPVTPATAAPVGAAPADTDNPKNKRRRKHKGGGRKRTRSGKTYTNAATYEVEPLPFPATRVPNEPTGGDCGPATVISFLRMAWRLYPSCFNSDLIPRTPVEVRRALGAMMCSELEVNDDDEPTDHWPYLFTPDGRSLQGELPTRILQRLAGEDARGHRARIAEAISFGEDSLERPPDIPVFWLSPPNIEFLLVFFIKKSFRYAPGRRIDQWIRPHPDGNFLMAVGPFGMVTTDRRHHNHVLNAESADDTQRRFQFICMYTGDHFVTFLTRATVSIRGFPIEAPAVPEVALSVFDEAGVAAGTPHDGRAPSDDDTHRLSCYDMEMSFPYVFTFPDWDAFMHPYTPRAMDNPTFDAPLTLVTHHRDGFSPSELLPRHWVWGRDFLVLTADAALAHVSQDLSIYAAVIDTNGRFCRAFYGTLRSDNVLGFIRADVERANDYRFPHTIVIPRTSLVVAMEVEVSIDSAPLPPGWTLIAGLSTYPHARRRGIGVSYADEGLADTTSPSLPAGTVIFATIPVRPLAVAEVTDPSSSILLIPPGGVGIFIDRQEGEYGRLREDCLLPIPVPGTDGFLDNCQWCFDPLGDEATEDIVSMSLVTTWAIRAGSGSELFVRRTWFDDPAASLSAAERNAILLRNVDCFGNNPPPPLRRHLAQMAEGIPRFSALLRHDGTFGEDIGPGTPWRQLRGEEARTVRQAKRDRRRQRHMVRRDPPPSIASARTILARLAEAVKDPSPSDRKVLEKRLGDINTSFSAGADSSDTSPRVRELLASTPPGLLQIPDAILDEDEQLYRAGGLEHLHCERIGHLRFRGWDPLRLRGWLSQVAPQYSDQLLALLDAGQQATMLPDFRPNQGRHDGRRIENIPIYHTHRAVIEDNAMKLRREFKSVIIREAALSAADMQRLHINTLFAVPKAGALARVVVDLSSGTTGSPPYNDSIDMEAQSALYPRPPCPQLRDFADMFSQMREKYPNCSYLHAAVVDARAAYQLFHLSFDKFLLVWMRLQIQRGPDWIHILVGNVCGTFGDRSAGDTWGLPANVVTHLVNMASALWKALIYVDDMTIAAAPQVTDRVPDTREYFTSPRYGSVHKVDDSLPFEPAKQYAILDAVTETREALARLFGPDSTEDRKTKIFIGCAETVGWHFDLRYSHWTVRPLQKKIEKMAHYLFNVVPPNARTAQYDDMKTLTGLLCWYSMAIPIGRSFVYSLYKCPRIGTSLVRIHQAAHRDLDFWRAIIRVSLDEPGLLACPIDLLRSDRTPTRFIGTDACTGVGGGAWIASTPAWTDDESSSWFALRWTKEELDCIDRTILSIPAPTPEQWTDVAPHFQAHVRPGSAAVEIPAPISINVLEFATAVFAVVVSAPTLRGQVVDIGTDNTAALCWLVRHRSSAGAADALLKLLALTCAFYSIRIIAHHVRGIFNYIPDWISRVLGAEFADPHEVFSALPQGHRPSHPEFVEKLHAWVSGGGSLSRRETARLLLSHILVNPVTMTTKAITSMMFLVLASDDIGPILDSRIPRVMTAFQRLVDAGAPVENIPPTLHEALAAAGLWDRTPAPTHV